MHENCHDLVKQNTITENYLVINLVFHFYINMLRISYFEFHLFFVYFSLWIIQKIIEHDIAERFPTIIN